MILFYMLRKKLKRIDAKRIMRSFAKISAASLIMGLAGWLILHGDLWTRGGNTGVKTVLLGGAAFVCVSIYITTNFLLRNEEIRYMYETMKKRYPRKGMSS